MGIASLIGPAVVAAAISSLVALIGFWFNARIARSIHTEKLAFDRDLAERKFELDKDLAEQKFKYDRDLQGHKRRVDFAEAILAEFLQIRDVIRTIRLPSPYFGESVERARRDEETDGDALQRGMYHVTLDRINKNNDVISSLMSKRYRSRAVLGKEIDEAFEIVMRAVKRIQISADALIHSVGQPEKIRIKNEINIRRYEEDIWDGWAEEDRLQPTLDRAVEIVDEICRPILERDQPQ